MRVFCVLLLVGCSGTRPLPDSGSPDSGAAETDSCVPTAWYVDNDGDGFGDKLSAPIMRCSQPSGYVVNNLDCGDEDNRMRPNQATSQMGPATGMTSGSPYDWNCDGTATVTNANKIQTTSCKDIGAGKCNVSEAEGWWVMMGQPMITSCSTKYDWQYCSTMCITIMDKRYPECL